MKLESEKLPLFLCAGSVCRTTALPIPSPFEKEGQDEGDISAESSLRAETGVKGNIF